VSYARWRRENASYKSCQDSNVSDPPTQVATFKIIKSVKEMVAFAHPIAAATKNEVILCVPEEIVTVASLFGLIDLVGDIIGRGASFRMLTDVSYSAI
jgi:hypothetical protein